MNIHTTKTTNHNAFTLIEVLIASLILGLGTLGLLVLFAGAAQQSREATETTASVLAANSAAAILAKRFSNIDGETGQLANISEGEWIFIGAISDTSSDSFGSLTIDPPSGTRGDLYFTIVQPDPVTLYEPAPSSTSSIRGSGAFATSVPASPDANDISTFGTPADSNLRDFPHPRLDPDSLNAVYIVTDDADNIPANARLGPRTIVYRRVAKNTSPNPPADFPNPINGWNPDLFPTTTAGDNPFEIYTPSGTLPGPANPSHVVLNLRNTDLTALDNDPQLRAFVNAFFIGEVDGDVTRVVRRIFVPSYTYRTATAISLRDRVRYNADGQPTLGYALLYRAPENGTPEIGVFTYAIRPRNIADPDGVNGQVFAPDESLSGAQNNPLSVPNDDAPLQVVSGSLAYDDNLRQYYVTVNDDDNEWALQQGQIILVANGPTVSTPSGSQDLGGADIEVRVVATRTVNGRTRGYLDRSPRARAQAMAPPQAGASGPITFAAVQEDITDQAGNRWQLQPRAFDIFPLSR